MFSTFTAISSTDQPKIPPKRRSQVPRACDWCRLSRVKCDYSRPCRKCELDKRRCSNDGQNEFRSLAAATKEVDRIREQNKDLERQLKNVPAGSFVSSPITPAETQVYCDDGLEYGSSKDKQWASVHITTNERGETRLQGLSSLSFFLDRLSTFITISLCQPRWDANPYSNLTTIFATSGGSTMEGLADALQKPQQDYFLDLFWQWYHCIYPIINEAEFRELYETLWSISPLGTSRESSPLVDIVMALCIQFGSSFISQSESQSSGTMGEVDSSLDRAYYQRCHTQLRITLETPDLTMVQCYCFSFIYLVNASQIGTAQTVLAAAIRMAYTLGLNQEPPENISTIQKELRRRIWWTLYQFDTQICLDQGQPWLTAPSLSSCRLPDDSPTVAQSFGPNFLSPSSNVTWLSFQKQVIKLVNTTRIIQTAFYESYNKVMNTIDAPDFYNDGSAREQCAHVLAEGMQRLRFWVMQVPEEYKTQRRSKGESFSTDRSTLALDHTTPLWLQRQRLLLELQFHALAMSLYRPFFYFSPTPITGTPLSDSTNISCLCHAIAITNIMHQVLTETDVLNGWHAACKYQQDAMFVLGAFACGYPVCPPAPSARKALGKAIEVLDMYGQSMVAARNAARLARELSKYVEVSKNRFRASMMGRQPPLRKSTQAMTNGNTETSQLVSLPGARNLLDEISADEEAVGTDMVGADAESFSWMSNDVMSMGDNDMWSGFLADADFTV